MTVDRRDFIPARVWPFDPDADTYDRAVDRDVDPGAWERAVCADIPLVTQWDDGAHTGTEPGRLATSSASMPTAVATMLDALNAREGMGGSFLDIGTGTGYTAARIADIIGPSGFVISVEVDPGIATTARGNLERAGVRNVEVVTADGFDGWSPGQPYCGVHVTCGIRRISSCWIEQCLPGANVVIPFGTDYTPHDHLLTLTVDDNRTASGRFGVGLSFMKMRAQRLTFPGHAAYAPDGWQDSAREVDSELSLGAARVVVEDDGAFAVGMRVPDLVMNAAYADDGAITVWLYSTVCNSVAMAAFSDDRAPNVVESGPRSLWAEVDAARMWWVARERPGPMCFGLTVGRARQRAWLDSPDGESWAV